MKTTFKAPFNCRETPEWCHNDYSVIVFRSSCAESCTRDMEKNSQNSACVGRVVSLNQEPGSHLRNFLRCVHGLAGFWLLTPIRSEQLTGFVLKRKGTQRQDANENRQVEHKISTFPQMATIIMTLKQFIVNTVLYVSLVVWVRILPVLLSPGMYDPSQQTHI